MNETPKWYHKAIVIIMMLTIFPTVLFQLHLIERITIQDIKIQQMEYKYKQMQIVSDKMEKNLFLEVTAEDIIKASKQIKRLQLIYDKKYKKDYRENYKF